jgi:cytochrome c553
MKNISFALSLCCISTLAVADGDAAAGESKSAACASCHGMNGISQAGIFPNLAGQKAEYLIAQLTAFKSGERKSANSAMMIPMAAGLSDQDMRDLAAYFSGLDASGDS